MIRSLGRLLVLGVCCQGIAAGAEIRYETSYDPTKGRPVGVGEVPDEAWVEDNGLRAAISAPKAVRFFERFQMYILIQNISDRPIRAALRAEAIHPYFTEEGKPFATGGYANKSDYNRWEIGPGQEIAIPFPPKVFVRGKGLKPTHAVSGRKPGAHYVTTTFGTGSEDWGSFPEDENGHRIVYRKDEWRGWFKLKPARVDVLDEDAELEILPLPELGLDRGVVRSTTERPELKSHVVFDLRNSSRLIADTDPKSDAHWIVDYSSYNRAVYWGPMSTATLRNTIVLDVLEKKIRRDLGNKHRFREGLADIPKLASLRSPFLDVLVKVAPEMGDPDNREAYRLRDRAARYLRGRRVALKEMGMAEVAEAALAELSKNDPPLPDARSFELVKAEANPADAPKEGWGPVNAGLQAAALIPGPIPHGDVVEARLFIRNVSEEPILMTVSKGGGYDYLSAVDHEGNALPVIAGKNFPNAFSSVIRPIVDPGVSSTVYYEGSVLRKLKLESGAIWELKTRTGVRFFKPAEKQPPVRRYGQTPPPEDQMWVSTITSESGKAMLTWELRTANGREYKRDSRKRHWPAKGGWSGILTTGPVEVMLASP